MKFIGTVLLVGMSILFAFGFGFHFILFVGLALAVLILGVLTWYSEGN